MYLEDLFDKNPTIWYGYYYKSLIAVKDLDKAEKITKKLVKSNKYDLSVLVHLGYIYKLKEEPKKETECYEKALKELNAVQPLLII
ncbi:MAG: hypothetical protein IPJ60_02465 [Sphingobacteriaceae bacterium]|nr:hypothetical protein [Sphingobacteriaceae bacterium]